MIIEVVKTVLKNIRNIDILGSLRGDEFIAILTETNEAEAAEVADRICSGMKDIEIKLETDIIKVQMSIALGNYSKEIQNLEGVIRAC